MANRHLNYLQTKTDQAGQPSQTTIITDAQYQDQNLQLSQLDKMQQQLLFEKYFLESKIMKSYSTRPGSATYVQIQQEQFYKFVMHELKNKDSEIYQTQILSGIYSQLFNEEVKHNSSIINQRFNMTTSGTGFCHQDDSTSGVQPINQFQKLNKQDNTINQKKKSSRYQDSEVSSQIYDSNYAMLNSKLKEDNNENGAQSQSPKQIQKKIQKNEDANDFFRSYEHFLEKMDESEQQDLIQAERLRQKQQKHSSLVSQKLNLPVINEIYEGLVPSGSIEFQQLKKKTFQTQTDQKVQIVEIEESSSVGSKSSEYDNLKILDFAEAWNQARQESTIRSSSIQQQPYLSKKKKKTKSCCPFFQNQQPQLNQDQQREKLLVFEMKQTPFDINKEFHRNLLYTIQVFFIQSESFIFISSKWLRLGFSNIDPSVDLAETGIFGLIQILYIINHFKVMMKSYFQLQSEFTKFKLCFFIIQLSKVVLELLMQDRLDQLILKYNSCINCLDLLLATIMFNVIEICRAEKKFDQKLIEIMLEAMQKKSDDKIQQLVLKFPQQAVEYQENC